MISWTAENVSATLSGFQLLKCLLSFVIINWLSLGFGVLVRQNKQFEHVTFRFGELVMGTIFWPLRIKRLICNFAYCYLFGCLMLTVQNDVCAVSDTTNGESFSVLTWNLKFNKGIYKHDCEKIATSLKENYSQKCNLHRYKPLERTKVPLARNNILIFKDSGFFNEGGGADVI